MNRKHRQRKLKTTNAHRSHQALKKEQALSEATEATSRARKAESKDIAFQMRERGYVANGKGGWRPLNKKIKARSK